MATSTKARRQSDKPVNVWHAQAAPLRLGDDRLRFVNLNTGDELGGVLTSVLWNDASMELSGSMEAVAPLSKMKLNDGARIRCLYAPSVDAAFKQLWTMSLGGEDELTRGMAGDSLSGNLASTLGRYRAVSMDFSYRKGKGHPLGWTCDEIAVDVARRAGIPIGKIARGTHRIKNLVRKKANPIDVILLAYRQEREATGRRFFGGWNGALSITVLTRSSELLEVMPVLIDASYATTRREDFATVLNVRATAKHGNRKSRKIRVRVVDNDAVKLFGPISKSVSPKNIDSEAEAREWGHTSLRRRLSRKREMTLTLPLMPTIRRGHALLVYWKDVGLNQVVFVRAAAHEWTPGVGTTTITVRFDDPYVDTRAAKNNATKATKAKQKGKPTTSSTSTPSTKNSKRRSDK